MAAKAWAEKPLIDFCSKIKNAIVDGPFGSNLKTIHYRTSGIPIITSGYVTSGVFSAKSYLYVEEEKFRQEIRSMVQGGDIVMAKIGANCGASAILPKDHPVSILSGNALKISIDEKTSCTKYVWYFLDWLYRNNKLAPITSTGAQPAISIPSLKKLLINAPTKEEQQKIADILSTWDSSENVAERNLKLKKLYQLGLQEKLLNKNMIKEVTLGEIGAPYGGLNGKTKEDFNGVGAPYVPYKNIFQNTRVDCRMFEKVRIDKGEKQNEVKYGDILFTTSSETAEEVGMSSVVLDQISGVYLNSFCFGYRLNDFKTLLPEYARFLFHGLKFREEMYKLAQGYTRYNISKTKVMDICIKVPSIAVQEKTARLFAAMEDEVSLLAKQIGKVRDQKRALLQKLLTGKITVKI